MSVDHHIIHFPVNQQEQAYQLSAKHLLARPIYLRIASELKTSLDILHSKDKSKQLDNLDMCRLHDAILIDGDRGTGKSSVLVNLESFLKSAIYQQLVDKDNRVLVDDLLILRPVDPTLLENKDDLLLNIIVAALLGDEKFRRAIESSSNAKTAEDFYQQLQKLSQALEGVQTHKEKFGMDRLRSFMGNQGLGNEIHQLFKLATEITDTRIIVLPIDDVDTSLELAFDNIEVIRKYLGSPFVIPIVSGDLSLYNEVIWRNFHGRLIKDSRFDEQQMVEKAKRLSLDYQQKVLPLPRQLMMPAIKNHIDNQDIKLTLNDKVFCTLKDFYYWQEAIVNQQVNGNENSSLIIPVHSVRDLMQLVAICRSEIEKQDIPHSTGKRFVRRRTLMIEQMAKQLDAFMEDFNFAASIVEKQQRRERRARAYQELQTIIEKIESNSDDSNSGWLALVEERQRQLLSWNQVLIEYLKNKKQGGAAYLVCQTNIHWLQYALSYHKAEESSVLDFALFSPVDEPSLDRFDTHYDLNTGWQVLQQTQVNNFKSIASRTILNYPLPDSGYPMKGIYDKYIQGLEEGDENMADVELIWSLMQHRSILKTGSNDNNIYIGRLFELLVMSLINPITPSALQRLFDSPPFYSLTSFYRLETLDGQVVVSLDSADEIDEDLIDIYRIAELINQWRETYLVQAPSAWLIHHLMNKVFAQVDAIYSEDNQISMGGMVKIAYRAFLTIVAACGSFERSNIFGLGRRVSQQTITFEPREFEFTDLYSLNVRPFTELPLGLGSITQALYQHPIKKILAKLNDHEVIYQEIDVDEPINAWWDVVESEHQVEIEQVVEPAEKAEKDEIAESVDYDPYSKQAEALEIAEAKKSYQSKAAEEMTDIERRAEIEKYEQEAREKIQQQLQKQAAKREMRKGGGKSYKPSEDDDEDFKDIIGDFGSLKIKYGDDKVRLWALIAGNVFYDVHSVFKGRSVTHTHLRNLNEYDFSRYTVKALERGLLKAKMPPDFVTDMIRAPKSFLCPKVNYRKMVTYLQRNIELGLLEGD